MNLYLSIALVLLAMAAGGVLIILVRRSSPEGGRADGVPTNVYAVTAGAMSLLTAFTFAAAFGMYTQVRNDFHTEAASVATVFRATAFMDEPLRGQLRNQVRCYAQIVATSEWQAMARGDVTIGGPAEETLIAMDGLLQQPGAAQQAGSGLTGFEEAVDGLLVSREQRISGAEWGVPPIVYLMILLGALITIGSLLLYADRAKPAWGHVLLIVGPVFVVAASLLVIYFFDNPFTESPGGVTPRAMIMTSQYMADDLAQDGPVPALTCPG